MCCCGQIDADGCCALPLWKCSGHFKLAHCCHWSSALHLCHQPGREGVHRSGLRALLANTTCQAHRATLSFSFMFSFLYSNTNLKTLQKLKTTQLGAP